MRIADFFSTHWPTVWQRTQVIIDPGSWQVKARFETGHRRLLVTVPANQTIQRRVMVSTLAFVDTWECLLGQAKQQDWQPTWADTWFGPQLMIILPNNHTQLEKQTWEQFANHAQLQPTFSSAFVVQQRLPLLSHQRLPHRLDLHLGHQKTEVLLRRGEATVVTDTFWWGTESLLDQSTQQQQRLLARWGWELRNWLVLKGKLATDDSCALVLSGGGANLSVAVDALSGVAGSKAIIVAKPELLLISDEVWSTERKR